MSEPSPRSPELAWRDRPDRLRWLAVLVDLIVVAGLFAVSLLFLLPLTPHLEISSDSMDPFGHAWAIWTGRVSPFSSHNLLYPYGRAWTTLPLLLGAEGLEGIATRMACASAAMTPLVYIAARILCGGTSPGPAGQPVRRVGSFLGPLLGAALFVRFPGFLWSQVAGSHVYLTAEWAALALIPTALLVRSAELGGGDDGPDRPLRGQIALAVALGVCVAMATLNHPYGASQVGLFVPLAALLGARMGRRGLLLIALAAGIAGLMGLPHAVHLAVARTGMSETLVEYARSDAEFGYLEWKRSFHRLTMSRLDSAQGWLLFQAPLVAVVTGLATLRWRPRLGGATAMVGALALSTTVAELLLTRISQHIQPYHWHPLLPLAALSAAMSIAALLDVAFRRSQDERIRDAERGRGLPGVVARRIPVALLSLALVFRVGQGLGRSLVDDRGYLETLWDISRTRQAFHHQDVADALLAAKARTGRLPVLGGIDFPDFSVTLDVIALTFELITRGEAIDEVARNPGEDEVMMLHLGLGQADPIPLRTHLPPGVRLVRGDSDFLLLEGRTRDIRRWTRRLCPDNPTPARLRGGPRDPYWVRGSLETRHLVVGGEFHPAPYPWAHPCMEPFAWPDIVPGEYPMNPPGTPPGELVTNDQYVWVELGAILTARTETTRRDWARCVAEGGCEALDEAQGGEVDTDDNGWLPIVGMRPEQALAYCRWLAEDLPWEGRTWTGDLPTSVEFEILGAWRRSVSESRTRYPWGDEPVAGIVNGAGDADGYAGLSPVGTFGAGRGPTGLEDLAGNAAEWLHRASRPERPGEDPWGRTLPGFVLGGGSFRSEPAAMRNGVFEDPAPDRPLDDVGFRCVIRGEDVE